MKHFIGLVILFLVSQATAGEREIFNLSRKILAKTPHNKEITPELLVAFAKVESSCNSKAIGDKGKARGLFQFHKARWDEFSDKNDYYTANDEAQIRVMIKALNNYYKKKKDNVCPIIWAGTFHNNGHGKIMPTPYTSKLKKTLNTISIKSYAKL